MRAVDTNVVVRYLIADDDEQFWRVCALFNDYAVFIATSVLLETEWVLRKAYRLSKASVVDALRSLAGSEGVHVQDMPLLSRSLDLVDRGLDFADALHVAASTHCDDFVSFDRALARSAVSSGTLPIVEPQATG